MAFDDDDLAYVYSLSEGKVQVTAGAQSALAVLDAPGEVMADGAIISVEYALRYVTAQLTLTQNQTITANAVSYKVRRVLAADDGKESVAILSKTS